MSDVKSLTVNRPLVERLQPTICCSGTKETCRDDEFCSSNSKDWPQINNGSEKTRLTYPVDMGRPSIPGVPSFCSAYMDWYTKTNCGPLAKDIAMTLSPRGSCTASVDPQVYIERIVKQVAPENRLALEPTLLEEMKSYALPASQSCLEQERILDKLRATIENRCPILYDTIPEGRRFNPDRAEDLNNLATFCQMVGSAEQQKLRASNPDGSHWKDYFKGGGAVAAVLGVAYALYRGVRAIVKVGKGISEANAAIDNGSKGLKNFFGVTLRNFGRSVKYVFGFGWLRGKPPPPDIVAPPPEVLGGQPANGTQRIEIHVHSGGERAENGREEAVTPAPMPALPAVSFPGVPHPDVVRAQFANLSNSEHHSREGIHFSLLSDPAQRYLAQHIIDRWGKESPERQSFFIADDTRLTEGKLPIGFLLDVARRLLAKEEMLPVIEASARVWQERSRAGEPSPGTPLIVFTSKPSIEDVRHQLLTDYHYGRLSVEAQEYFARRIIAKWESLRSEEKLGFIGPKDDLHSGALPLHFLRIVRKRELQNPKALEVQGRAVVQLLHEMPELSLYPFPLVDMRAGGLLTAWASLPAGLQAAFAAVDVRAGYASPSLAFPRSFVQHMKRTLWRSASSRQSVVVAAEPWDAQRAESKFVDGYDLREIMEGLVQLNDSLAYYPAILELRARTILDGWMDLDETLRTKFFVHEGQGREEGAALFPAASSRVPAPYLQLWHIMSHGIGTTPRPIPDISADRPAEGPANAPTPGGAKDPKKGGSSGPTGSGAPGGGTPVGGGEGMGANARSPSPAPSMKSFGGLVIVPESKAGMAALGIHDTQPMSKDEMEAITSGAEFINASGLDSTTLPVIAPMTTGLTAIGR